MKQVTISTEPLTDTSVQVDNNGTRCSNRNGMWCALAIVAAIWMVYPIANMGVLDDFSYAKTAYEFARTGHIVYNGWATAMLGWQIPWGALFIKIFGFSFNVIRFSMLPIAMATVYLFHQILLRFGINSRNAVLGALALGLSPIFLQLVASFMTDIPGLLVILVCIYMCQRAVEARSDRTALLWLFCAMTVNVAGGTVRQLAWLGALIMVPSTAWLLRERRGMKITAPVLFLLSLLGVLACLHWFNRQPYSVPEHIYQGQIHPGMLVHLAAQLLKAFLSLLFVAFPVSVAWLLIAHRFTRRAKLRIFSAITGLGLLGLLLHLKEYGQTLLAGLGISLLVLAPIIVLMEYLASHKRLKLGYSPRQAALWKEVAWILGPFSLCYVMLLLPRGTYSEIYGRYMLGLVPIAIVSLLKLYQERITAKVSVASVVTLAVVAMYGVSNFHNFFAESRAIVSSIAMVQDSGVPRTSIRTNISTLGLTNDGWAQIEYGSHINDPRIQVPAGAYNRTTPVLKIPDECTPWDTSLTPVIVPRYFLVTSPMPCFAPTKYRPVHFRTWLPPFDQAVYVQQLKNVAD